MSWRAMLDLLADEVGLDVAMRIERRLRAELGGVRITIGVRPWMPPEVVHAAAPHQPRQAARKLGISPATAYRVLERRKLTIL